MSGLVKAKTFDWKDSNIALIGSDQDRKVKKSAAETEIAWKNAGEAVGLKIWRIVNFKVTDWPTRDYGRFFSGDSYIILNTYHPTPKSKEFAYDLHFWIGGESTQDEYGTAAYKTVELDTYLDDKPIQHREVEGYESDLFKSYFKNGMILMNGGADSGFQHVKPTEYTPRLLHFCGDRKFISLTEIPLCRELLSSDDVYILDLGLHFYQWNGSACNMYEKFNAASFLQKLKSERNKSFGETLDEIDTPQNHEFYSYLVEKSPMQNTKMTSNNEKVLIKVTDESGEMKTEKIKTGTIVKKDFDSKDVFILDTNKTCFVWIGKRASQAEKQNGVGYAHNYLMDTSNPLKPISVIKEGQINKDFEFAVAA